MSKLVFMDYINTVMYASILTYKQHNEPLYQHIGEYFVIMFFFFYNALNLCIYPFKLFQECLYL